MPPPASSHPTPTLTSHKLKRQTLDILQTNADILTVLSKLDDAGKQHTSLTESFRVRNRQLMKHEHVESTLASAEPSLHFTDNDAEIRPAFIRQRSLHQAARLLLQTSAASREVNNVQTITFIDKFVQKEVNVSQLVTTIDDLSAEVNDVEVERADEESKTQQEVDDILYSTKSGRLRGRKLPAVDGRDVEESIADLPNEHPLRRCQMHYAEVSDSLERDTAALQRLLQQLIERRLASNVTEASTVSIPVNIDSRTGETSNANRPSFEVGSNQTDSRRASKRASGVLTYKRPNGGAADDNRPTTAVSASIAAVEGKDLQLLKEVAALIHKRQQQRRQLNRIDDERSALYYNHIAESTEQQRDSTDGGDDAVNGEVSNTTKQPAATKAQHTASPVAAEPQSEDLAKSPLGKLLESAGSKRVSFANRIATYQQAANVPSVDASSSAEHSTDAEPVPTSDSSRSNLRSQMRRRSGGKENDAEAAATAEAASALPVKPPSPTLSSATISSSLKSADTASQRSGKTTSNLRSSAGSRINGVSQRILELAKPLHRGTSSRLSTESAAGEISEASTDGISSWKSTASGRSQPASLAASPNTQVYRLDIASIAESDRHASQTVLPMTSGTDSYRKRHNSVDHHQSPSLTLSARQRSARASGNQSALKTLVEEHLAHQQPGTAATASPLGSKRPGSRPASIRLSSGSSALLGLFPDVSEKQLTKSPTASERSVFTAAATASFKKKQASAASLAAPTAVTAVPRQLSKRPQLTVNTDVARVSPNQAPRPLAALSVPNDKANRRKTQPTQYLLDGLREMQIG